MPREILEFRVIVASPSDLFETRKAVFEVIAELNRTFEIQQVAIRGLGWEEYVTPGAGSEAQDVVSQQLLTEYDILIAIFATKLGSPTANAASGTVEEIEHAIAKEDSPFGKYRVQVYFRDKLDSTSNISIDDFKSVIEYREKLKSQGILYALFREQEDLQREIRVNLQRPILEYLSGQRRPQAPASKPMTAIPTPAIKETVHTEPSSSEDLGLLDHQEAAEEAMSDINSSMEKMTSIVEEIAAGMNQEVAAIEAGSFSTKSAKEKKDFINQFSSFLKEKANELKITAAAARSNLSIFRNAVILLANLEQDRDSAGYETQMVTFLTAAESVLTTIAEARMSILAFKDTVENLPRITAQFNQAKRQLVEATTECLEFHNEFERTIFEITAGT